MSLDIKRKKLELSRVQTAKQELEFKIDEKLEEIERLKEHIKTQEQKENQLIQELAVK
jgi:hypothetical protein